MRRTMPCCPSLPAGEKRHGCVLFPNSVHLYTLPAAKGRDLASLSLVFINNILLGVMYGRHFSELFKRR